MPSALPVTMSSPFQWLLAGFASLRRDPRTAIGAFLLIAVVVLVPSALQLIATIVLPGSHDATMVAMGLGLLYAMLVVPPVFGAGFRLVHALQVGAPARAGDVLAAWRDGDHARRMILTSLLLTVVQLVLLLVLYVLMPGRDFLVEVFQRALATPPGTPMDVTGLPPVPPPGFLLWLLAVAFVLFVLGNAWSFASARAALDRRPPVAACIDGLAATFRCFLPLCGFAIVGSVFMCLLGAVLGMVFAVVIAVASLVGPDAVQLATLPLNLLVAVPMYAVVFGFYYHGSRQVFGAAPEPPEDAIAV
ncbi:hypothetical protein [Arenimonas composti]|uniref:Glycerophosphoryl diester phosphodiesterase membrane domain-containing protein n=1 Tax=Arenimonas composti TR7-09 = DSM 18010 TaxID=1121013 RepID=A0A091BA69_9GAMM|nr:hypothetical protein [Arenimonas composti]KFN49543.1 hypothetical protein P873_10340 [Arenimonas composti TR7-09 = DSM 18010]